MRKQPSNTSFINNFCHVHTVNIAISKGHNTEYRPPPTNPSMVHSNYNFTILRIQSNQPYAILTGEFKEVI